MWHVFPNLRLSIKPSADPASDVVMEPFVVTGYDCVSSSLIDLLVPTSLGAHDRKSDAVARY